MIHGLIIYFESIMNESPDHMAPMSLRALAQVSQHANIAMNAMAQFTWVMEKNLNPRRLKVEGNRTKAIEDFNRLSTDKGYFISTAIFLNSVDFERRGNPSEYEIDHVRVDMTKAEITRKLIGGLDATFSSAEYTKNKRKIERITQSGIDFGLYKIHQYSGCGAKKPLVTTPLLNAIMKSTHGDVNIATDFVSKYPPVVNYAVKDGKYA